MAMAAAAMDPEGQLPFVPDPQGPSLPASGGLSNLSPGGWVAQLRPLGPWALICHWEPYS